MSQLMPQYTKWHPTKNVRAPAPAPHNACRVASCYARCCIRKHETRGLSGQVEGAAYITTPDAPSACASAQKPCCPGKKKVKKQPWLDGTVSPEQTAWDAGPDAAPVSPGVARKRVSVRRRRACATGAACMGILILVGSLAVACSSTPSTAMSSLTRRCPTRRQHPSRRVSGGRQAPQRMGVHTPLLSSWAP